MAEEIRYKVSIEGDDQVKAGLKGIANAGKDLSSDIQATTNNLKQFEAALKKSTNPKEIDYLSRSVTALKSKLEVLNAEQNNFIKSSGGIKRGADQASQALINVGRVAQDSAFGFIGIANNLNPLLESFQRLQKETGSSGASLRALGSSLLGAGGIGLGLSVVTAALSFATIGFEAWTRGIGGSKDALDGVNLTLVEFDRQIRNTKENLSGINRASDAAFKTFESNVKEAFGSGFAAQLEVAQGKFVKISEELVATEQAALEAGNTNRAAYLEFLNKASQATKNATAAFGDDFTVIPDNVISNLDKDQQAYVRTVKESSEALTTLQNKVKELQSEREAQGAANRALVAEENRRRAKELADRDTIEKQLQRLRLLLAELNKEQQLLGIGADDYKKKVDAILSTAKTLVTKFKVDPNSTLIAKLLIGDSSNSISGIESVITTKLKETIRRIQIGLKKEFIASPVAIPVEFTVPETTSNVFPKVDLGPALSNLPNQTDLEEARMVGFLLGQGVKDGMQIGINKKVKELKMPDLTELYNSAVKKLAQFRDLVVSNAIDQFTAIGDGLGNALAGAINGINGGDFFGTFFQAVFQSLGAGLRQLGVYVIASSKLIAAIKKSISAAPQLAIPLGIALVALGTLVQQTIAKQKFAVGGTFDGSGGSFIAGERGPELISAPAGTRITPASQTASLLGSGRNIRVEVVGKFDGRYITLANRYGESALRRQN